MTMILARTSARSVDFFEILVDGVSNHQRQYDPCGHVPHQPARPKLVTVKANCSANLIQFISPAEGRREPRRLRTGLIDLTSLNASARSRTGSTIRSTTRCPVRRKPSASATATQTAYKFKALTSTAYASRRTSAVSALRTPRRAGLSPTRIARQRQPVGQRHAQLGLRANY
jgi:hypothetical protein